MTLTPPPQSAEELICLMPFKRITSGPLIDLLGQGDWPPAHLVVETPVLEVFFDPPPNCEMPVAADCHITEIKQPVNIRTQ